MGYMTRRKNNIDPNISVDDVTELEHYFKDYMSDIKSDATYFDVISRFNQLPLDEKRIFIIYILCECNASTVAKQLGASDWTVRTKVLNIRRKLQNEHIY